MTPYEAASLWAQWVGSISAALAVVVAAIFGYLTLANDRRSKDAQQRATLAAAQGTALPSPGLRAAHGPGPTDFTVRHASGNTWLLVNAGTDEVFDVRISGLTDLDKRRVRDIAPASLAAGEAREFVLISRYTRSGPANIVVTYRTHPGGSPERRVLAVPAE